MKTKHKILFIIAAILAVASWVIAIYYWDKMPNIIPTHFGFSGQPDSWAEKSIFYVYMIPFLQSLMLGFFIFLYFKPQYSDIPTTMWLMALDEKPREHAFSLIRVMLIGTSLWVGALFTYLTYGIGSSSLDKNAGLIPWIMMTLVGSMIIWLIVWTIKVYRATREAIQKHSK